MVFWRKRYLAAHAVTRLDRHAARLDACRATCRTGFGPGESHLARYASRVPVAEINSSFHRPHKRSLYEKWAASVPAGFRFCAKLPKTITHERRLVDCEPLVDEFLAQAGGLGDKLGCLLVQLPPSFAFDADARRGFFEHAAQALAPARVAMEPRHASWFDARGRRAAGAASEVARVLADPVRHAAGAAPGGWPGRIYLRLHGSPRVVLLVLRSRAAAGAGAAHPRRGARRAPRSGASSTTPHRARRPATPWPCGRLLEQGR